MESVLALYPGAEVQPHKYGDEVKNGASALILETWGRKVQSIRAGRLPEAQCRAAPRIARPFA